MASLESVKVPVELMGELSTGLVVHPGDTLILVRVHRISEQQHQRYMNYFEEKLPGVEIVWLDGFNQALIYRPEGSDGT